MIIRLLRIAYFLQPLMFRRRGMGIIYEAHKHSPPFVNAYGKNTHSAPQRNQAARERCKNKLWS